MSDPSPLPIGEWGNFYVITGSAAAALTGLMFVVIALRRDATIAAGARAVSAFGTPNVLHFCGALLIASILTVPGHTVTSLAVCLGGTGISGLALSSWVAFQARRQSAYAPVVSDWVWHVALPCVAYATVAAAAPALPRAPSLALDLVAGASLLLVFIGIHNAWDSAVWIATRGR